MTDVFALAGSVRVFCVKGAGTRNDPEGPFALTGLVGKLVPLSLHMRFHESVDPTGFNNFPQKYTDHVCCTHVGYEGSRESPQAHPFGAGFEPRAVRGQGRYFGHDGQVVGGWPSEASSAAHDVSDCSGRGRAGRGAVRPMSDQVIEVPVTARIPESDRDNLQVLADRADRSRSAEVRRAIREYIERELEQAA